MLGWGMGNSYILLALPLFVFMGEIIFESQISQRLFNGFAPLVRRLPGRLLHANILSCCVFSAVSGSSVATAATVGTIAIPDQLSRKYSPRHIFGSLAAGGTLGILIPPSLHMMVYAVTVQESIGRLFIAGILPGLLLALFFMVHIGVSALLHPEIAPSDPLARISFKILLDFLPATVLIMLVIGSILFGIATPSESASLGALGAMALAFCYKSLSWAVIKRSLLKTVSITSMLALVIFGAGMLSFALNDLGILERIVSFVTGLKIDSIYILVGIYLMYIVMGCFFEGISMMIMTLPFTYPIIKELGYDPVWFGIVLVLLIEMSLITPPVGINLFVIQGIAKDYSIKEVIVGSFPYIFIMTAMIVLVTAFPELVLWLPKALFTVY